MAAPCRATAGAQGTPWWKAALAAFSNGNLTQKSQKVPLWKSHRKKNACFPFLLTTKDSWEIIAHLKIFARC